MERLPNRYPKISQSHKVPLYKGLSLFYPKLLKYLASRIFFYVNQLIYIKIVKDTHSKLVKRRYWYT